MLECLVNTGDGPPGSGLTELQCGYPQQPAVNHQYPERNPMRAVRSQSPAGDFSER